MNTWSQEMHLPSELKDAMVQIVGLNKTYSHVLGCFNMLCLVIAPRVFDIICGCLCACALAVVLRALLHARPPAGTSVLQSTLCVM